MIHIPNPNMVLNSKVGKPASGLPERRMDVAELKSINILRTFAKMDCLGEELMVLNAHFIQ